MNGCARSFRLDVKENVSLNRDMQTPTNHKSSYLACSAVGKKERFSSLSLFNAIKNELLQELRVIERVSNFIPSPVCGIVSLVDTAFSF